MSKRVILDAVARLTVRQKKRLAFSVLRAFIGELRGIYRRRARDHYRRFPDARRPCESCAFNPRTDRWPGFGTTMMNLYRALRGDIIFRCHVGTAWKKELADMSAGEIRECLAAPACGGWAVIAGDPNARRAMDVAAEKVARRMPRAPK